MCACLLTISFCLTKFAVDLVKIVLKEKSRRAFQKVEKMRIMKSTVAIAVASIVLSGCVVTGPSAPPPRPAGQSFAEGNWNQGGLASYVFGNGSFVGTAADTGNKVADGNYRYISNNTIQISSYSSVQQKTIVANCLLVAGGNIMNCTNDSGLNFSLSRA